MNTNLQKYWQAYCEGDRQAFEKVFTSMFDPLFFKVITLTKDRDLAKDIVQETLIKLYQVEEPSQITDIQKWTFRVAKNLFISEYRKVQTRQKYLAGVNDENAITSASFTDENNFLKIIRKYLSSSDFHVFQLELQGYPIPEIASMVNKNEKTIYNRRTEIRKIVAKVWNQVFVLLILLYI